MRKSVFLLVLLLNLFFGFSQANLLNTKSSFDLETVSKLEEDVESQPLDYAKVSDEDIIFSFTTWEVIDLNERVNFPLLFPIDESVVTSDRKPLIRHLINGISDGYFPAYFNDTFTEIISDEEFENIQIYKSLKEGVDADGLTEGKEHFNIIGSWREHLESLGYQFPEEEWVTYDPLSDEFLELDDNEKVESFQRRWNAAAASVMPDTDFNSAEFENSDVRKYVMKGVWYFDRISTELKYRPIALGPVAVSAEDKYAQNAGTDDSGSSADSGDDFGFGSFDDDEPEEDAEEDDSGFGAFADDDDDDDDDDEEEEGEEEDSGFGGFAEEKLEQPSNDIDKEYTPMFWVFYPDVREVLSKAYSFNQKNMSKPFSFDRLINSRRFSGTIYKEANVYQDRDIRDYLRNNALMQLIESDRIKDKIRNKEQDMWSY
jgi:hypothetical protein